MVEVSFIITFIAGILSFLSPCILPIVPGFLAFLAGTTPSEAKGMRFQIFLNSVFFVLGFSLIFAILGVLLRTALEASSDVVLTWLGRIGGLFIILFGLYLVGLVKIPLLDREHKFKVKQFNVRYVTSFMFGAAFAVGWTPCVGAVLGAVLTLAATAPAQSFFLLLSYSLGLGLPFLAVGLFTTELTGWLNKLPRFLKYFNIIVGILLILLGVLVFTQNLNLIANLGFINKLLLR